VKVAPNSRTEVTLYRRVVHNPPLEIDEELYLGFTVELQPDN